MCATYSLGCLGNRRAGVSGTVRPWGALRETAPSPSAAGNAALITGGAGGIGAAIAEGPLAGGALFDVNCMGAFLMMRAAVPPMVEQDWGRVVNVTTSFFTMLNEGFAPYGPAKAALEAASAIWAKEFQGTGVTVNVLIPGGPSDTRMVPASAPFPRKRLISPVAMAPPPLWLASPASGGRDGAPVLGGVRGPGAAARAGGRAAGAPIAWPGLTTAGRVWPER